MPELRKQPTVSVILPVRNREGVVARAIQSVLAQTMGDLELILVDDASFDGTPKILERFRSDKRVVVLRSDVNLGAGGARNAGIQHATGRYVAFQDSDDRWLPEKLERQLEAVLTSGAEACYSGAIYYSHDQCYYIPRLDLMSHLEGDLRWEVLRSNPMTPQTMLVRRSILEKIGGFDAELKINEDWDFVLRLAGRVEFAFVSEPMVLIYRTPGSLSSNTLEDAVSREFLTERHRALFDQRPAAFAHQRYVAGCQFLACGFPHRARANFRAAMRAAPNLRVTVRWLEGEVRCLLPQSRHADQTVLDAS